jgi:hypothetical protein
MPELQFKGKEFIGSGRYGGRRSPRPGGRRDHAEPLLYDEKVGSAHIGCLDEHRKGISFGAAFPVC